MDPTPITPPAPTPTKRSGKKRRRSKSRRAQPPVEIHPLLRNSWVVRFLPGLLLGFAFRAWLGKGKLSDAHSATAPLHPHLHGQLPGMMSGGGGGGGGDENEHDDDDDDEDEDEDEDEGSVNPAALQAMLQEELKMVLIVNMQLKMGKGKIAAQCAHAAVGVLTRLQNVNSPIARQILMAYQGHGQPKITLQAPDLATLRTLEAQARERGMPTYLVSDAGRTQIAAGSKTVLAIGPAPRTLVDQVAGDLKLL